MITQEKINELIQQVTDVIAYSQDVDCTIDATQLIQDWADAKAKFIEQMDNQLIYEYPDEVAFELGEQEKKDSVEAFAYWIENRYALFKLGDFVRAQGTNFFTNYTDKDYSFIDYNNQSVLIKKGTKIVKDFKYFVKDKNVLFDIQNKASGVIQDNKIHGKLCISVHPLDFLSSSENTYNWRSCHALDGEYRAGNLSYMVDTSTVICYLKGDDELHRLNRFPSHVPWNSKKWRVLLFFSNDWEMLFLGRQYPFTTTTGATTITTKLLPSAGWDGYGWTPWFSKKVQSFDLDEQHIQFLSKRYIPVGGSLKSLGVLIKDGVNAMNFNDLLRSSCYDPLYCYQQRETGHYFINPFVNDTEPSYEMPHIEQYGFPDTKFFIGGPVRCLHCGKQDILCSETMLCNDCESDYGHLNSDDFGYCNCCGRHFNLDEATYVDDDILCPECADREVSYCDHCGAVAYNDNLYETDDGRWLCHWCYSHQPERID